MTAIPDSAAGACHYAALVFPADAAPSPAALIDRLDCWLEQAGHGVRAARLRPANGAAEIETDGFRVTVMESLGETARERRLAIRLEETGGTANAALLALIGITYALTARLGPVALEWQEPGARIGVAEFLGVVSGRVGRVRPARPARVRRRGTAEPTETAARSGALRTALRAASGRNATARPGTGAALLAWGLTGAVAVFCLPLAPVLAAVNLRHGPDPRLPAQAMSLVGLFLALDHAGAFERLAGLALS